jgi:hypothetical protein
MWTGKCNDLIGNQTRDLPAYNILPQPTTLPRTNLTASRPDHLTPTGKKLGTHSIRNVGGHRDNLDDVKRRRLFCTCRESNPCRPAVDRRYTDRTIPPLVVPNECCASVLKKEIETVWILHFRLSSAWRWPATRYDGNGHQLYTKYTRCFDNADTRIHGLPVKIIWNASYVLRLSVMILNIELSDNCHLHMPVATVPRNRRKFMSAGQRRYNSGTSTSSCAFSFQRRRALPRPQRAQSHICRPTTVMLPVWSFMSI